MIQIISIVIWIVIVSLVHTNRNQFNNLGEISSRSVSTDVAGTVDPSLAELAFTPLLQSHGVESEALGSKASLSRSAELTEIQMSPPAGGRWEQICTSFIREVLASVSGSSEISRSPKGQNELPGSAFGREVERTVYSLKAIAKASTEFADEIPAELRVSLQSLGSLAETIRASWSSLARELGNGIEVRVASGQRPINDFTELLGSITSFQSKVDEVAHDLASQAVLTDQLRRTLGTLGQTLHQSLIKLSGREVYAFASAS